MREDPIVVQAAAESLIPTPERRIPSPERLLLNGRRAVKWEDYIMGRKSSGKTPQTPTSLSPTPPKRGVTPLLVIALLVVGAAIAAFMLTRSDVEPAGQAASQTAAVPAAEPAAAKFGPHKQANLPPLPFQAYAPPRSPEVVRAAYLFAAEHPEIL